MREWCVEGVGVWREYCSHLCACTEPKQLRLPPFGVMCVQCV